MMPQQISDKMYSVILDTFVIVCADVVPINRARKTIFLARRAAKPMQGWWVIGGRMWAGEKEHNAMHRKFLQETSVDIEPMRFEFVRMNRYHWKDRQQEPQDKGSDTLAYTFAIELTEDELRQSSENLEKREYEAGGGLQEFNREDLVHERVHEAVLDLYDQIFKDR